MHPDDDHRPVATMTEGRYLRRAAWTLAGCAAGPALFGLGEMLSGKSSYGLPTGFINGGMILFTTAIFVGGALLLVWLALGQRSFLHTLLIGFGLPLALAALIFWLADGGLAATEPVFWVLLPALPVLLGDAAFHGQDGRAWLRRGAWALVPVALAIVNGRPHWWLPLVAAAILWAVLYRSIPGKPADFQKFRKPE